MGVFAPVVYAFPILLLFSGIGSIVLLLLTLPAGWHAGLENASASNFSRRFAIAAALWGVLMAFVWMSNPMQMAFGVPIQVLIPIVISAAPLIADRVYSFAVAAAFCGLLLAGYSFVGAASIGAMVAPSASLLVCAGLVERFRSHQPSATYPASL